MLRKNSGKNEISPIAPEQLMENIYEYFVQENQDYYFLITKIFSHLFCWLLLMPIVNSYSLTLMHKVKKGIVGYLRNLVYLNKYKQENILLMMLSSPIAKKALPYVIMFMLVMRLFAWKLI